MRWDPLRKIIIIINPFGMPDEYVLCCEKVMEATDYLNISLKHLASIRVGTTHHL